MLHLLPCLSPAATDSTRPLRSKAVPAGGAQQQRRQMNAGRACTAAAACVGLECIMSQMWTQLGPGSAWLAAAPNIQRQLAGSHSNTWRLRRHTRSTVPLAKQQTYLVAQLHKPSVVAGSSSCTVLCPQVCEVLQGSQLLQLGDVIGGVVAQVTQPCQLRNGVCNGSAEHQ